MNITAWLVIGTLLASPAVMAQEANPYSGTWRASVVNKQGETRQGTVVLAGQEGNWDITYQNVKNPCTGIRAPIVIRDTSEDKLVFEVVRSRSLKGCKDNIATLQRVNDTTLEGELDDGRKLTLTRE